MAFPPKPDVSCVRCKLDYSRADGFRGGSRFYLSYSGTAPSGTDCTSLATSIGTQWASHLAYWTTTNWILSAVEVIDITTDTGASATVSTSHAGTNAGFFIPAQDAANIEFGIARRYRGGKPRMYLPPGDQSALQNDSEWAPANIAALATALQAFFASVTGLTIGSMGTLKHVNLSYYHGHDPSTGKPTYRPIALHDDVLSYIGKANVSSQRRRTIATTP